MGFNIVDIIRGIYQQSGPLPLHSPTLTGREIECVTDAITSTYVSSVGEYVNRFEAEIARYTGAESAVAVVNGTAALHVALRLAGVEPGSCVLTQPVSFVATCNAIAYCGASPIFIDVDRESMSMSQSALQEWLSENAGINNQGRCSIKSTGVEISACVPMHTFGHPANIMGLKEICQAWGIPLIEDAAESLGSFQDGRHTGIQGHLGILSFNGNKIITTGGGGIILSNKEMGQKAKHLTTTAKVPHPFDFFHDQLGYNYRMPNLNAALGCAQLERIEEFVKAKRSVALKYSSAFRGTEYQFVSEPPNCRSNYWLNSIICPSRFHRDEVLKNTNSVGIMTRPMWTLLNHLPMYRNCITGDLRNSEWLADRIVNLPSSVPMVGLK